MNLRKSSPQTINPQLVDMLVDEYVTWREESAAVSAAYGEWTSAPRDERDGAYAAYVAALGREERAAGVYGELVGRIQATSKPRSRVLAFDYDAA